MTLSPIGIAGTGPLAAAIAARLAGHGMARIIVHGFTPGLSANSKRRIETAANLFDLASECEAVIAVYDSHAALRAALTGTQDRPGLLGAMAPGNLLVDFSAGTPDDCRRLAGQLAARAIGLVEGALSGGPAAIDTGTAGVGLGGFKDHVDSLTPVLAPLGQVTRVGPQGSARLLLALKEAVHAAHLIAIAEAGAVANAYGIADDSFGDPPPSALEKNAYAAALGLARTCAEAHRIDLPLLTSLSGLMQQETADD